MPTTLPVLTTLRPEARLLLLSAGGEENDGALRALLREPLDWPLVIRLAENERATAVFWRRLQRLGVSAIPEEERQTLERLAMVADFRASYLERRLSETVGAFAEAGIEVVLLKGSALALWAYPSFAERPMGDVDLLVEPSRGAEAHAIARRMGWEWDEELFPAARYAGHHHLPPLQDARRTGARLELHTALFIQGHPFALTEAELRGEGRRLTIDGREVVVPSAEHHLVHLAVHFGWSDMMGVGAWRTFRDVGVLLGRQAVDWPTFLAHAERYRATTLAYWTLRMSRTLAGIRVPEDVEEALRPEMSERMLDRLERHLAHETLPAGTQCPAQSVRRLMWEIAVRPVASGHGRSRPWDQDDRTETAVGPGKGSGLGLLRYQIASRARWQRYLRLVVSGR